MFKNKRGLFLLIPVLILATLLISSCIDLTDSNTLLHEGKVQWIAEASITFVDGASYTGDYLGVMDYDSAIYCETNGASRDTILSKIYTDIDYKLYCNTSTSHLLLVPSDYDHTKPFGRPTLGGGK